MYEMRWFLALTLVITCLEFAVGKDVPIVDTSNGRVRGYEALSRDGKPFYGFQTIPYAKAPIGRLRFKVPQPVDRWDGIHDGTLEGQQCPQWNALYKSVTGDEDCLHLNVYAPKLEKDSGKLVPVMFWIHGGGFVVGSGRNFYCGPQYLMDYPIVLVTINYRLGVLGFFNTGDENAVGNFGMLDQVMALKWVQQNIENFGGDPNKVTIFGLSAGSAAVIHHLLSPLSTGLFHKAIAQSGTAINDWAFQSQPLEWARSFARHLKCPDVKNTKNLIKCLSEKSAEELISEDILFRMPLGTFFPLYAKPSIDGKGGPGFLNENPIKLLKSGKIANKVPLIIGLTATEGYTIYTEMAQHFKLGGRAYIKYEFPSHLAKYSRIKPNMTLAIKAIANEYYDNVDVDNKELFDDVGIEIVSDATFNYEIAQTVELFSSHGIPTYVYQFDHVTELCYAKLLGGSCGKYSSHGDEVLLQFVTANITNVLPESHKMADILNGLWTSFALDKDLNLNEKETWPAYDGRRRYAVLNLKPSIRQGLLSDKIAFWTKTLPELMSKSVNFKEEL